MHRSIWSREEEKGQELKRGAGNQSGQGEGPRHGRERTHPPSYQDKKGQRAKAVKAIKVLVIPGLKAGTALEVISTDAELVSDATSLHNLMSGIFKSHDGRAIKHEDVGNMPACVHHAKGRF